jgi:hypothetical protein
MVSHAKLAFLSGYLRVFIGDTQVGGNFVQVGADGRIGCGGQGVGTAVNVHHLPPISQQNQRLLKPGQRSISFDVFRVGEGQPGHLLDQHALAAGQVDEGGVVLLGQKVTATELRTSSKKPRKIVPN